MRQHEGLRRAAAVLLQATLVVGLLSGCGVAVRPDDGARDLPHFASQAPSKEMGPSPRLSVSAEASPVISGASRSRGWDWSAGDGAPSRASTGLSSRIGSTCLGATLPSWSVS
jgi:hypothetical protein